MRDGELKTESLDRLTTLERLRFFRKICDAVAEAHRKGIVHRDIKPENILLKTGLIPVVGDFGICFLTDREPGSERLTEPYRVMASRWFGAPEAKNGRVDEVKPSADVYSLGKLLYWIICGETFEREEHRTPRYALDQEGSLDPTFELISRLLDKAITASPAERTQSAIDLLSELDQLIEVIEAGGHAIGIDVRQRCIFCARGRYAVMVDEVTGPPEGSKSAATKFGLTFYDSHPRARPLIMVCDYCGNVQMFRPDLPHPRPGNGFDQKLQQERIARWSYRTPTGK